MTIDILTRSYEFLSPAYLEKRSDMWLGEIYEYAAHCGEGTIERYSIEPGIELAIMRHCTHERLAESLPYHQQNMVEITALSKGALYVRYAPDAEWICCDRQELHYFSWSDPISYYDYRCEQASGISLYLNMDLLPAGKALHQKWATLLQRLFDSNKRMFKVKNLPVHRSMTAQLMGNFEENVGDHFLFKSRVLALLSHCVNDLMVDELTVSPHIRIRKVKEKIDISYDRPLQVNKLAKQFDVPIAVLQHQFKQSYGVTVYQYIQKRRIEAAIETLMNTTQSVTDIAIKVGYENPSKFAAVFKKHYGMPPMQYRKVHHVVVEKRQS
ncbi:helix-turn-helix transcriptional regulator [Bacillus sp. NPDC077027]|uniref:AraC family transcriptional regulator n=1 Tax=Bacillus sp. NPDC077027 TaxID=3390548 RepID=UPI003CFE4BAF